MRRVAGQQSLPGVLARPRPVHHYPTAPILREPLDPPVITTLDLAYSSTGVAWLDTLGYVGVATVATSPVPEDSRRYGLELAERRAVIVPRLRGFIAPTTLVVREARIDNLDVPGNSALDLAALHASVEDMCQALRVPLASVNLQRLKVYGANSGRANKDMMVEAARREFAGLVTVVNDDEADALWLLALAAELHGLPMARRAKRRAEVVQQCRAGWPVFEPVMPSRILTRLRSGN